MRKRHGTHEDNGSGPKKAKNSTAAARVHTSVDKDMVVRDRVSGEVLRFRASCRIGANIAVMSWWLIVRKSAFDVRMTRRVWLSRVAAVITMVCSSLVEWIATKASTQYYGGTD